MNNSHQQWRSFIPFSDIIHPGFPIKENPLNQEPDQAKFPPRIITRQKVKRS